MLWLIRKIRNQLRKAEAAAALQNLLETQVSAGNFEYDPHITANRMISETWDRSAKYVDWNKTKSPHKVSLVAIAIAERLQSLHMGDKSFFAYGIALGTVLTTVARRHRSLGFQPIDHLLLAEAIRIQEKVQEELEERPLTREINALLTGFVPKQV